MHLMWASTGTKEPAAANTLYIEALAAPHASDTMPDKTLLAFADHGRVGSPIRIYGGDAEADIALIARHGVDLEALATQLQHAGGASYAKSWDALLGRLREKTAQLG